MDLLLLMRLVRLNYLFISGKNLLLNSLNIGRYLKLGLLASLLFLSACTSSTKEKKIDYKKYNKQLKAAAKKHKVDWMLAKAILIKESRFKPNSISYTGAVGLMQLMPRENCYTTTNYDNFIKSRRKKSRTYKGKKDKAWSSLYRRELKALLAKYEEMPDSLYAKDKRFDPAWNIEQGIIHYKKDYEYFRKRGHSKYKSRLLAFAAYNAGRGNVVRNKKEHKYDTPPINRQTELYVIYVERIYQELLHSKGRINSYNNWIMKL